VDERERGAGALALQLGGAVAEGLWAACEGYQQRRAWTEKGKGGITHLLNWAMMLIELPIHFAERREGDSKMSLWVQLESALIPFLLRRRAC